MNFEVEIEQETDGRWIAEIPDLPGVLAYGVTPPQAEARAKDLALRVLAERKEEDSIPGTFVFAFNDEEELGPKMLTRLAKHTGLTPDNL